MKRGTKEQAQTTIKINRWTRTTLTNILVATAANPRTALNKNEHDLHVINICSETTEELNRKVNKQQVIVNK